jgi:ABC-type branched-subunit amino acid transport system substrate-binding protein
VLILQGKRDLQVSLEDASRLKNAQPRAKLVTLDGVNHVLKQVASDDRRANMLTYADASLPIDPAVTEAVATMVLANAHP